MKNILFTLLFTGFCCPAPKIFAKTMHTSQASSSGTIIKNGKTIQTWIIINCPAAKVWQVLSDFEAYPDWNPFIREISGNSQHGDHLRVTLRPPESKGMTFKPRILCCDPEKELRWIGKLMLPYVFDGEHVFTLTDNSDGTCTFTQSEHFRGLLVPFLKNMLDNNTRKGFILMNEALKRRCEAMVADYSI